MDAGASPVQSLARLGAAVPEDRRAYLDLPWHRRITRECLPDPALEALARWRAEPPEKP